MAKKNVVENRESIAMSRAKKSAQYRVQVSATNDDDGDDDAACIR